MNRYRIKLILIDDQIGAGVVEEGQAEDFDDASERLNLMWVSAKERLRGNQEERSK